MYESYWQLNSRPFEHTRDERFDFAAQSQRGAVLKLRYVVENRRGAALLAGESGLGKTFLVQKLLAELDETISPRVHVVFPQMPPEQLLTYLADQLTGQYSALTATIDQNVRRIENFLLTNAEAGKHALIAIDEAHLLAASHSLEAVRLLMNFERNGQPLATFLFSGQTGLVLAVRRLPPLDERMAVTCILNRLSTAETKAYIEHRLTAAGAQRTIFDPSAVTAIYQLASGVPRRINRLCDLALLVGYGEELRTITGDHIESIHAELIGNTAVAA
jgi:type II secretory pathway predicted ATPase ExeA